MRIHKRGIISPYFEHVKDGRKKFEIRRESPVNPFWVNDLLILTHEVTEEKITCRITYIYDGEYGLQPEHKILGVEVINGKEESDATAIVSTSGGSDSVDDSRASSLADNENVLVSERADIRRRAGAE